MGGCSVVMGGRGAVIRACNNLWLGRSHIVWWYKQTAEGDGWWEDEGKKSGRGHTNAGREVAYHQAGAERGATHE